ncbi:MAG: hypothetical protein V2A65_04985 [Candidatus Omnitrophota bacterium]
MGKKRLGELLIEKGLVTDEELQKALMEQYLSKEFLGAILVKRKIISEVALLKTLAEQFGMLYLGIKNMYLDLNLGNKFPTFFIIDHKCFPIAEDDNSVTVAVVDPLDAATIAEVAKKVAPKKAKIVLTSFDDMTAVIDKYRKFIKSSLIGMIEKMNN